MNVWTVKKKLAMMIAAIIISFMVLVVFLLSRQTAITSELQRLYEKDYQAASIIGQIDGLLTRVDINILRMIAIGDRHRLPDGKVRIPRTSRRWRGC